MLLIISAALETWYAGLVQETADYWLKARFVITCVCPPMLTLSHMQGLFVVDHQLADRGHLLRFNRLHCCSHMKHLLAFLSKIIIMSQ